jgi:hypothetical protein
MSGTGPDASIRDTVLDIFRRYTFGTPEGTIQRIEQAAGIRVDELTPANAGPFLEAMRAELSIVMEAWKARFVTGVLQRMISQQAGR